MCFCNIVVTYHLPPQITKKPQKPGEVVSNEKREYAYKAHTNKLLCVFVT